MRKVRWGVLSTAKIGRVHVIPAMQKGEATMIAAIASRDAATARRVADELGIETAYGSYEALLADPTIEAIYNPLPNHLHVPWTLKALEAGKHVLCEKPVALDAAQAEQLVAASARTGRLVAEAFMVRHHPQWRKALEIVQSGRLGEVRAIQTLFAYHLDDPANIRNQADIGGGGLYDIGCYAINTARYLFGAEPERVVGAFDIDPVLRTDRMMSGLAAFPKGASSPSPAPPNSCRPSVCRSWARTAGSRSRSPSTPRPTWRRASTLDDGRDLKGGGREVIDLPPSNQYTRQGDSFSRAVLGETPLPWGIADAVLNMRVIDAFFRSGRSERWERP